MARLEGITGGLSGKMGSAVFRQSGGKTIASQYQPIVKNPNSEGQQERRAAFKLMTQLAAVMSAGFGSFIIKVRKEKSRPSKRNAFFQTNYRLIEVSKDVVNGVVAKIPMEKLQLTSSFRQIPAFSPNGTGATTASIHAFMTDIPTEVASVRVVCVGYRTDGVGTKQAYIESIQDIPVADGEIDEDLDVTSTLKVGDEYTLLAFGLIPSETASKTIDLDNIHTPDDENFISAVKLDQMVSDGLMSETITVGVNLTVTQA